MGLFGLQVAVIDRDFAVCVAFGLELGGRAEDEVFAVGGEVFGDEASGLGRGLGLSEPGHALDQFAIRKVDGIPV